MIWRIDRIEDGIAVIESQTGIFNVELKHLPQGVKSGNKLFVEIDEQTEKDANVRIKSKMERLFSD